MTEPLNFQVSSLIAAMIDGFLVAATRHLGAPDGDARQAYLALESAHALLEAIGPFMEDEVLDPFLVGYSHLTQRFGQTYPGFQPPAALQAQDALRGAQGLQNWLADLKG